MPSSFKDCSTFRSSTFRGFSEMNLAIFPTEKFDPRTRRTNQVLGHFKWRFITPNDHGKPSRARHFGGFDHLCRCGTGDKLKSDSVPSSFPSSHLVGGARKSAGHHKRESDLGHMPGWWRNAAEPEHNGQR